jgi:hypothetical protein
VARGRARGCDGYQMHSLTTKAVTFALILEPCYLIFTKRKFFQKKGFEHLKLYCAFIRAATVLSFAYTLFGGEPKIRETRASRAT